MSLRETLEEMERSSQVAQESAEKKLSDWITSVSNLYSLVEELLADLKRTTPPLIQFSRRSVQRTEELTGTYKIDELLLRLAGRTLTLSPVGLFVIGAYGRVDLYAEGRLDLRYLLLRGKTERGENRWVITPATPVPRLPLPELPELSRSNLEEAIENLLKM